MVLTFLLPVLLGAAAVMQAALNRQISTQWGLAPAVFLNSLLLVTAGLTCFLLVRSMPESFPAFMRDRGSFQNFKWWYFLPGFFGFCLVAGIPFSIHKVGALKTFVALIGAQLVTSLIWDAAVENMPISLYRVLGAGMAFFGALLATFRG